jgi:hypothetical protein
MLRAEREGRGILSSAAVIRTAKGVYFGCLFNQI